MSAQNRTHRSGCNAYYLGMLPGSVKINREFRMSIDLAAVTYDNVFSRSVFPLMVRDNERVGTAD